MLETLLKDGWAYHDTESERLAGELEATARSSVEDRLLVPLLKLSNHTLGEHLGDWPRARRLAETVLEGREATAETATAWAALGVARFLAGDPGLAMRAELAATTASSAGLSALIEARFMLVAALVSGKRLAEAAAIYDAALGLARQAGDAAPHRAVAVASNNLASELLEAPSRTPAEAELMQTAARAAHDFWLKCGDWVNEERALYLRALTASVLGDWGAALTDIDRALAIIAANGEQEVDTVFLRLARSKALAESGDEAGGRRDLALADAAAAGWSDAGLKAWFTEERARATA